MRILIPGAAGTLAQRVVSALVAEGHEVAGIDQRPWENAPIEFHRVDVRKRGAEDVFRRFRPEAVVHMATVTSLMMPGEERYRLNLGGTRAVFAYAHTYGVQHCVFVGRHTFYGAGPEAPLIHGEDDPPGELNRFPELADLVAADLYSASALWRFPALATTVLRVCYTLGPSGHGTLASFLRGKRVPVVWGFDPLFQFLHEDDAVRAIVLALASRVRGVFNVAGPEPLPLMTIVHEAGRIAAPLPELVLATILGRFGLPKLPTGALAHLKYPILVDARAFREQTGFVHQQGALTTIRAFRDAIPPPP